MVGWAHMSLLPKRHFDRFSRLCSSRGYTQTRTKDREIRPGSPPTGAPNARGVGQNRRFSTNNRLHLENGKR